MEDFGLTRLLLVLSFPEPEKYCGVTIQITDILFFCPFNRDIKLNISRNGVAI